MTFQEELAQRSAAVYADFFMPSLKRDDRVLDVGCGSGAISVGLGDVVDDGQVIACDLDASLFEGAIRHLDHGSVDRVRFLGADATALPFNDGVFDAAFCHSLLEATPEPLSVLGEISRVLVAGGALGAASVDYGGLLLAGPERALLERFYELREQLWSVESIGRSRAGRDLRGLFSAAGLEDINATARYVSYGHAESIRSFGEARASECVDQIFTSRVIGHGLITAPELRAMEIAWRSWSQSDSSFLAFPWCRATGHTSLID